MIRSLYLLIVIATVASASEPGPDETQIWRLEKSYWEYAKGNDLEKYRSLWHEKFVGWPSVSPSPTRKDHITDWITEYTSKGLALQWSDMEQLAIEVTGDVAVDHYRIRLAWTGKGKSEPPQTIRITHTWIRSGGTWQIIGGMSAPTNAEGK